MIEATMKVAERPKLWWSHHSLERRSFRWWSYLRGREFLSIETALFTGSVGVRLATEEARWCASLRIGIASLYVSWPGKYRSYGNDREIEISLHSGSLWWRFWTEPMSWSSSIPKWRHGNLNFVDMLLGRDKCEHYPIEEHDVLIPMPEGAYPATAKLEQWTWRRPRWFARSLKRVTIDIPKGVPVPGKGENSWDCGDDAIFGTTVQASSIAEGVGMLVGSALRTRIRYGGWSDWKWDRPHGPDEENVQEDQHG